MTNLSPAQKVQKDLRTYGLLTHLCLGVILGTFIGLIITDQGRISSVIGLIALVVYYLLTVSSARMLNRSVTVVANPTETKETNV